MEESGSLFLARYSLFSLPRLLVFSSATLFFLFHYSPTERIKGISGREKGSNGRETNIAVGHIKGESRKRKRGVVEEKNECHGTDKGE